MNETRDSFTKAGKNPTGPGREALTTVPGLSLPVPSIVFRFLRGHSFERGDCECAAGGGEKSL